MTNSAPFVNGWIRRCVWDANETVVGLAIQWSTRNTKPVRRDRISLVQIATSSSVLIVQMAQLQNPKIPSELARVLADPAIRKVAADPITDAMKLERDWGVQVLGRVGVCEEAIRLGYCGPGASISEVAKSVLALEYRMPYRTRCASDWGAVTLSDMQLTCAGLEAFLAREALGYMETQTAATFAADIRPAAAALRADGPLDDARHPGGVGDGWTGLVWE